MKVRFTPNARRQFLAALAYIRADNPEAAGRLVQRAEEVLNRLEQFPESGRVILEFPELPYREVVITPYRFFYRLKGETVWVVAVWHGALGEGTVSGAGYAIPARKRHMLREKDLTDALA